MCKSILSKITVFLVFLLIICSCEKELVNPQQVQQNYQYNADQRLWEYFNRFEEEGRQRGIIVDLNGSGVTGEIKNIPEKGVVGLCQYGYHRYNDVTIDANYWNRSNDPDREFVVFHELGHCFLLRDHLEDSFQNNLCVSIMRSGLGTCRDAYNFQNRAYYLDELFSHRGN